MFRDVTGDKRDDAVVRVHSGGVNGVVAVYVFSTANKKGGKLRAIFRTQSLMRASTRVLKGVVSYRTARYDPATSSAARRASPSRRSPTTRHEHRMRVKERVTFAPPPEAQAPAAPAPPENPN